MSEAEAQFSLYFRLEGVERWHLAKGDTGYPLRLESLQGATAEANALFESGRRFGKRILAVEVRDRAGTVLYARVVGRGGAGEDEGTRD